ncbi:hypothetical protein ACQPWY_07415 [Pseudonocardia xinjiangensis]|uniref:hypothetical protein n=1 Tax=Pseudonocardia xinjiangensis TaxID=75289 RepID=UPI003D8A9552
MPIPKPSAKSPVAPSADARRIAAQAHTTPDRTAVVVRHGSLVLTRLQESGHAELGLIDLIKNPTVEFLSAALAEGGTGGP